MSETKTSMTESEARLFNALSEASGDAFFVVMDFRTRIVHWSKAAVEYFGFPAEEAVPTMLSWVDKIHPDDVPIYAQIFVDIKQKRMTRQVYEMRIKNVKGEYVWVQCSGYAEFKDGHTDIVTGFINPLAEKNRIDATTNLRTVTEFRRDMETHLAKGDLGFVYSIKVRHFKAINDTYGYLFGNEILQHIGTTLLHLKKSRDIACYRLDHSHFVILCLDDSPTRDKIEALHEYLKEHLHTFVLDGKVIHVHFIASSSVFPTDGDNVDKIQQNIYYAIEEAKKGADFAIVHYSEEIYQKKCRLILLQECLIESVKNNFKGFKIVLQPIVSTGDESCVAAESLLRYENEKLGFVSPMEFIPILERTELIIDVGKWVIDQCLKCMYEWRKLNPSRILKHVHVNISYIQFKNENLKTYLEEAVRRYNVNPESLVLELTESCRIDNSKEFGKLLDEFRDMGFPIALDDFGTGYASLQVLQNITTDILKLDLTLTRSIVDQNDDKGMLFFLIGLAKKRNMLVCAEGIETANGVKMMTDAGVNWIQGYYYSKPIPVPEFTEKYIVN